MSIEYFYQILSDPTTCMEFPKNYRMTVVFSQLGGLYINNEVFLLAVLSDQSAASGKDH